VPLARSLFRKGADFTAAMAFEIASTNIGITWNYTTWLTIAFLLLAAGLLVRFWRTGGPAMVQMMDGSPDHAEHEHGGDRMYNGHHH
jgi:hypothetical protein